MKHLNEKIGFEIKESPVLYHGPNGKFMKDRDHKVIFKDTTGEVLSTRSNSYYAMPVADFERSTADMAEISGMEIEGYDTYRDGQIILSYLSNPKNQELEIGGNPIQDHLVLGSSYDGSTSFFVGTSTVLIRCMNEFSRIIKSHKIKHTKNFEMKKDDLFQDLEIYFAHKQAMMDNFKKFTKIKMTKELRAQLVDYVMRIDQQDRLDDKVSTRKSNQIELIQSNIDTEVNDLGDNLWAGFNGITRYTTHDLKQKYQSFGNLFGAPNRKNSLAYEFALKQC